MNLQKKFDNTDFSHLSETLLSSSFHNIILSWFLPSFSYHSCLIVFSDSLPQPVPSLLLVYCITLCFTEIIRVIRRELHHLLTTKSTNLPVSVFIFLFSSSYHGRSSPFRIESQSLTLCNEGKPEMYIIIKANREVYPKKKRVVKLSSIFIALVTPLQFSLLALPMYPIPNDVP